MSDLGALMVLVVFVWLLTWGTMRTTREEMVDEAKSESWRQGWLDRGAYENERHKSAIEESK